MENKEIKEILMKAQELVKDIDDDVIRGKAFEIAYNELSNKQSEKVKPNVDSGPQIKIKKPLSVKEYLTRYNPKSDVIRVLVLGNYLETEENIESFNAKDLKECFLKAKEKIPSNISDKIYKNIKGGFLMDATEKKGGMKAYIITRTGEEYLEKLLIEAHDN